MRLTKHDQLLIVVCHIYPEGDRKKQGTGNNEDVSPVLMKTLGADIHFLDDNSKGKELSVVFDNCPGQNSRKHHVLWLVPYLVEKGYFHLVNFIFLLRGAYKERSRPLIQQLQEGLLCK
jgi:hypothetical protein